MQGYLNTTQALSRCLRRISRLQECIVDASTDHIEYVLLYLIFRDADVTREDFPLLFCYGWKILDVELRHFRFASALWFL